MKSIYSIYNIYSKLKFALIVLGVLALGLLCIYLLINIGFKMQLVMQPCQACRLSASSNKEIGTCVNTCLDVCDKIKIAIYPDGFGNWKTLDGRCFNFNGEEIKCNELTIVNLSIQT